MKDLNKQIRNRLKKAKDIHNVINNLKDKNYKCIYGNNKLDNGKLQEFYTIIGNGVNITIYYEQNNTINNGYKQLIHYILY